MLLGRGVDLRKARRWQANAGDGGYHPQICGETAATLAVSSRAAAHWHYSAVSAFVFSLYSLISTSSFIVHTIIWLPFQDFHLSSGAPPELCIDLGSPSSSPHIDRFQPSIRRAS